MTDRNRERYKKRMRQLILVYTVITIIVGSFLTLLLMNAFSDKKKFRDEGITAFGQGNYTEAEASFQKSLNESQWFTGSMDLDTRMYLGACYLREGKYDDAAKCYKTVEDDNNGAVDEDLLHSMIGTADAMSDISAIRTGQVPVDDTWIEQLLQKAENQPYVYLCIASVYNERGDTESAGKLLEKYLAVRPVNTYVAYELSAAYINQGKTAEATDMINKGLSSVDGTFADLLKYNQAILKEMEGDFQTAFSMLEELCKQYPDNADMKREYDFLYTRLNINETPVNPYTDAMSEEEIARAKAQAEAEAATEGETTEAGDTDGSQDGETGDPSDGENGDSSNGETGDSGN